MANKAGWTITVTGVNQTVRRWRRHTGTLIPHLKVAMQQATLLVERESIKLCPVGQYNTGRVGGRLRNSIKTELIKHTMDTLESIIEAGGAGTNVEHAIFVHEGHYFRNGKGFVLAKPWMRQAMENKRRMVEILFKLAIRKDLAAGLL